MNKNKYPFSYKAIKLWFHSFLFYITKEKNKAVLPWELERMLDYGMSLAARREQIFFASSGQQEFLPLLLLHRCLQLPVLRAGMEPPRETRATRSVCVSFPASLSTGEPRGQCPAHPDVQGPSAGTFLENYLLLGRGKLTRET